MSTNGSELILHVCPMGSSKESSFSSLQAVQEYIRKNISGFQNVSGITVELAGGVYPVHETLELGQADCFHDGRRIVYRSAPGELAILDGGKVLTGGRRVADGLWAYELNGLRFRQVYVNGEKAVHRRYPKKGKWLSMKRWNKEEKVIELDAGDFSDPESLSGCELVIARAYVQYRVRVDYAVRCGDKILVTLKKPERDMAFAPRVPNPVPGPGASYYIEDYRAFPAEPGEWYRDNDTLYVRADSPDLSVTVPVCETLLRLKKVQNLTFMGLCFRHTTWLMPDQVGNIQRQGGFSLMADGSYRVLPAAVEIEHSHGVALERNLIEDTGANGICFGTGTHENLILGNKFLRMGDTGIVYDTDNCAEDIGDAVSRYDTIESNYFLQMGEEYHGSAGIWAFFPNHLYIVHNEIEHSGNLGMDIGFGGTYEATCYASNRVSENKIHDCSFCCNDCGAIHTKSNSSGTVLARNWIYDMGHHPVGWSTGSISPVNGIYLDNKSRHYLVYDNVLEDISGLDYTVKGRDNDVRPVCTDPDGVRRDAGMYACYQDIHDCNDQSALWYGNGKTQKISFGCEFTEVYAGAQQQYSVFLEEGNTRKRILRPELDDFTVFSSDKDTVTCTGTELTGQHPGCAVLTCTYHGMTAQLPVTVKMDEVTDLRINLRHSLCVDHVYLAEAGKAYQLEAWLVYRSGKEVKASFHASCGNEVLTENIFCRKSQGMYELTVNADGMDGFFRKTVQVRLSRIPDGGTQVTNYQVADNPSLTVYGGALMIGDDQMAVFSNGEDFWGLTDRATLISRPIANGSAGFELEMKVYDTINPNGRDVVGIMIRDHLGANSKNVCLRVRSEDHRIIMSRRAEDGGKNALVVTPEKLCTLPVTLRLRYENGICTACYQSDGEQETYVEQCNLKFEKETVYAGVIKASFIEDYLSGAICTQCKIKNLP